ncbi:hypothetical protein F5X99DRAFT_420315 [Biscogniauxia marginata]|nr:hypothetical protein F5X99DRAFT_420315 [Biscogniauxia marginata]
MGIRRSGTRSSSVQPVQQPNISTTSLVSLHEHDASFREKLFTWKRALSGWFPRINDSEKTSWHIRMSKRSQALLIQSLAVIVIFIANLTLTIYTTSKHHSRNGVGIHLLINIFSTGMLLASNYCIQLQVAPTRADTDDAHKKDISLDIGVLSIRNFRYVGGRRRLSCILLAFSSIPIHLLYNSAVFQSLSSNDYTIAVVTDSFVLGKSWNISTAEGNRKGYPAWDEARVNPPQDYNKIISDMQLDVQSGVYIRENISACFATYNDYLAPQGNGVVVIKNASVEAEDSLLLYVSIIPRWDNWPKNMWALSDGNFAGFSQFSPVTDWYLGPQQYEVSHCLVQQPSTKAGRCRIEFSTYIMYTVCTLNFIIAFAIVYVWITRGIRKEKISVTIEADGAEPRQASKDVILSTLGDAIASFMQEPDETTKKMCLATKENFPSRGKHQNRQSETCSIPRKWKNVSRRWLSATSRRQWVTLLLMYIIYLAIMCILIDRFLVSLVHRGISVTLTGLWRLKFGELTPWTYLVVNLPREDPVGLISNVVLVNSPQFLFSMTYSVFNTVLTTFLVQREFSLMYSDIKRKPLRVSEPVGMQRSSYFISLPLRYGAPFYAASSITHWLISRSFFLARITALTPDGSQDYDNSFSTLAFSPIAMIITTLVAFTHMVALILLACRKYDGVMSMVSTNSKAISAACHSLPKDRKDGYQLPVQWGVVGIDENDVGHCAFTTAPSHTIKRPQEGIVYQ